MILLAVDTSGKHGSIALANCRPGDPCRVLEVLPLAGGTFSAQLVPQIAALLARHRLTKSDVQAFAVASGPGSFTGLRVGLAAVKALAEVLPRPIAAVSLLEAVAAAAKAEGTVLAALDAGRGEIYVGEYKGVKLTGFGERLLSKAEFLSAAGRSSAVTPDKTVVDLAASSGLQVAEIERPNSGTIAVLGYAKIQGGQTIDPEALDANYIRRSDAEIFARTS